MFTQKNNKDLLDQAEFSSSVSVTAETNEILLGIIFGNSYYLQTVEDHGAKPFIGFLLHVDREHAYIEIGASKLLRPTIIFMDRNSLDSMPHKIERQKVHVNFEGKKPTVKFAAKAALAA